MTALTSNHHLDNGLLRLLTCGSVDDGKSTLIGRLLFDSKSILTDTLSALDKTSQKRGLQEIDLALLTDGLQAEREQGITIDVAYRYFSTGTRKYIIADAPGHEQYTRNMVTAASTANLAIILVDARKGIQTQTRRHSYLSHLVGIENLVVAVNKMDLVDYSEDIFETIKQDYLKFAEELGIETVEFIPLSALKGDMVVERGDNLDWYQGNTLMQRLELGSQLIADENNNENNDAASHEAKPFRFPVQYVCRPKDSTRPELHDYRGFMGRVESGEIKVGESITVLPSGKTSTVEAIELGDVQKYNAIKEQSVTLLLSDEIDISRGDMIVKTSDLPTQSKQIDATICWFDDTPLDKSKTYQIRHTTRESKAKLIDIKHKIDVNNLEQQSVNELQMNDIAQVSFKLANTLFTDAYKDNRATGAFIVIDSHSNNTVGAGMIS
ncbi:GTP-binding protein [Cocleimonas sp. KMM 6892]|uniref:sulfate adenylyltransferase subunit 1 n=1 Tax=unclassified Cocleimonas TaxID=2639732 RepID=UPI002DB831FC|nr:MULTISPECIES: GTP-binding protein [unclassified Cocleimonas]MEB8433586.1 GTP-binding protein [Cocleimonas sp. KMM 6892]MEC4716397.1 GTP-binding protein [Cocleimonas sp. KMM 6895]MEC4745710.1 GTP-binding protein [Cocleimonas sp. KMM 6896]